MPSFRQLKTLFGLQNIRELRNDTITIARNKNPDSFTCPLLGTFSPSDVLWRSSLRIVDVPLICHVQDGPITRDRGPCWPLKGQGSLSWIRFNEIVSRTGQGQISKSHSTDDTAGSHHCRQPPINRSRHISEESPSLPFSTTNWIYSTRLHTFHHGPRDLISPARPRQTQSSI